MTVPFAVGAAVTRADIPCLCTRLADLLRGRAGPGDVECDVSAARADLVTVEALARLRLTAGRYGRRFVVTGARPDLRILFSMIGLGGLASGGQTFGEAEEREQTLGVEEVVDAGDPPG
ncbi:STAS domain-containing protein [Paractinoplanes lichenicola]|uniref:STAS domain-containing protein n=1 Tax=Paractinoplanes lichenicola TaxID=2802976 RepID=A0ABS1VUS6_9ACTN|nr:STAS domain-containing protein [Actinoplanes lichenicola]MBL7258236.1 STAS domain-containing protein [Actinoplanes lichenicola]